MTDDQQDNQPQDQHSLDEIMKGASHKKILREGQGIAGIINGTRIPKLIDLFSRGLDEGERSEFNNLSDYDKVKRLEENNYKIKEQYVDELVEDLALTVIKENKNDVVYDSLKKSIDIRNDKSKSIEERQEAAVKIKSYLNLASQFIGEDINKIKRDFKENGVSEDSWKKISNDIGNIYTNNQAEGFLHLASDDELHTYLSDTIKPDTGIDSDLVKSKGIETVKSVALNYHQAKESDDVAGFKKTHHKYHKD